MKFMGMYDNIKILMNAKRKTHNEEEYVKVKCIHIIKISVEIEG